MKIFFADMSTEKRRLCDELELLDDNFDKGKQTTKEHKNIYASSYDNYMTYVERKIEAKDKETKKKTISNSIERS